MCKVEKECLSTLVGRVMGECGKAKASLTGSRVRLLGPRLFSSPPTTKSSDRNRRAGVCESASEIITMPTPAGGNWTAVREDRCER